MISKLILGLFFVIMLFQAHQVYGDEELPVITVDFISGNEIALDKGAQIIRANIEIQNYEPQNGYHFMQITRLSDGEIIKNTEILPRNITNELFGVQVSYYLEPGANSEELIGEYELRIYSEFGSSENVSTFYIVSSSMSSSVTSNTDEELVTPEEESDTSETSEESEIVNLEQSESKIPSWVHDIFVWYADKTISENELLAALEYLIAQEILNVNSN